MQLQTIIFNATHGFISQIAMAVFVTASIQITIRYNMIWYMCKHYNFTQTYAHGFNGHVPVSSRSASCTFNSHSPLVLNLSSSLLEQAKTYLLHNQTRYSLGVPIVKSSTRHCHTLLDGPSMMIVSKALTFTLFCLSVCHWFYVSFYFIWLCCHE